MTLLLSATIDTGIETPSLTDPSLLGYSATLRCGCRLKLLYRDITVYETTRTTMSISAKQHGIYLHIPYKYRVDSFE